MKDQNDTPGDKDAGSLVIVDMQPLYDIVDRMNWDLYVQEGDNNTVIGFIIGDPAFVEYASRDCHE